MNWQPDSDFQRIGWIVGPLLEDIRNLCDHNKQQEPTADEVAELAAGVDKIAKSVV